MSTAAVLALVLGSLWLGALTFVVLLLIRQLGLITVRLDYAPRPVDDGVEVGSVIHDEARVLIDGLGGEPLYLLFVSPTCAPCARILEELHRHDLEEAIICLAGDDELTADFASLFPPSAKLLREPEASVLFRVFGVKSTPLAFQVEEGVVTGKAYPSGGRDLAQFIAARATSHPEELIELARSTEQAHANGR